MKMVERGYLNPTVHIPPWPIFGDPTVEMVMSGEFLLSNEAELELDEEIFASDYFRMFEFKVRKCTRGRSHDWTECPFTHPGEKARRRDPRKFHYSGTPCPEFRNGNCKKGDACEYGHGVFECWLHPSRYRTQPCKDGLNCHRRICFFAHLPDQLRILSPKTPNSANLHHPQIFPFSLSGESLSPPLESPPSISAISSSLQQIQLSMSPPVYGSTLSPVVRPGFFSLPTTPTGVRARGGIWPLDQCDEGPTMDRVESGRDLRAKMLEKLSRENFLDRVDPDPQPDVGWVSDLLK